MFYLIMAPTCKRSDASNSDVPQRSCEVLSLSETVHIYRKSIVYIGFGSIVFSGMHWGSWNVCSMHKGGRLSLSGSTELDI